jgi:hypothetical protein
MIDNRAVTLIGRNVCNIDQISFVQRREKDASTKNTMACPLTVIKYY